MYPDITLIQCIMRDLEFPCEKKGNVSITKTAVKFFKFYRILGFNDGSVERGGRVVVLRLFNVVLTE